MPGQQTDVHRPHGPDESQHAYTGALTGLLATDPDTLRTARVIYAFGGKPAAG